LKQQPGVALTIGVFDGVHRGHQDLVRRMVQHAEATTLGTACITFDPDPDRVLHPERRHQALSTLDDRVRRLRALGIDRVDVMPFSRDFSLQSPEEFVTSLQATYPLRSLWVGSDFALGRDRKGTVERLKEIGGSCGFAVVAVEPLPQDGRTISATWIREALDSGEVELAARLLGRPYCLDGVVGSGMRRGRQIGFPTANILPPHDRALPADGVYFVRASLGGGRRVSAEQDSSGGRPVDSDVSLAALFGVVNLGSRPTFDEAERLVETHLLDYSGDLYGERIDVCFLRQIRGIRRFPGIDELRSQIARDVAVARSWAASEPNA
jgi:riboflavin kinase/FMN adenylyltransferase